MLLKENMSAYTQTSYVYTTLSQHLRSFRFFLFVFFYICIFVCTTCVNAIISLCFVSFYVLLCSPLLSHWRIRAHTRRVDMCVSQFRFLSSHFFDSLHTTTVTLEMRDEILLKTNEECTYMHVAERSRRQRTFAILYVFLFVQLFIQGHRTDRNHSINRIVCIQIYSIRQTRHMQSKITCNR